MYVKLSPVESPKSNTPEPDRPKPNSHAACGIAQQYSSDSFVSLGYSSSEGKIERFKKILFQFILLL